MAVEADHKADQKRSSRIAQSWLPGVGDEELSRMAKLARQTSDRLLVPATKATDDFFARLSDTALWRYISSTLLRRIIVSNLLGLIVLFFGVLYLSQFNVWLIDAKRESLESQSRIIAGAIASSLTREDVRDQIADPQPITENDPFADLTFSLGPERVTPVLRRLLAGTQNQARIYDRKGNLVAHSAQILPPGGLLSTNSKGEIINRPKTKNFWTRLREWFLGSDLRIYKELGDANGQLYPEVRKALGGKSEALLLLTGSGKQIVSVATPITLAGTVQGVLLLSTRPGEVDEALAEERLGIFALAFIALCAAMLASFLLARTVAGPMRALSRAAESVTRNIRAQQDLPDFEEREDEVGQLGRSYRAMTAALYRRIEASEKFAADVAHELKNPLTAARSTAESLTYAKTDQQRDALVVQIQEELKRLNRLITDVSNASRMDAELALHTPEPVDLAAITKGVSETFQDLISDTGKSLELRFDPSTSPRSAFIVSGHEGRLAQVLTNLIDNALSFSPDGGTVKVKVGRENDNVVLTVSDEGPGIETDKLETIFSRFYTYRPTNEGSRGNNSGLGLSISNEIVTAHGGKIWAENRANDDQTGARFVVTLPAADAKQTSGRRVRRSAGTD